MTKTIVDEKLGIITLTKNNRARRLIIRLKPDCITVTLPIRSTYDDALKFVESKRDWILANKDRVQTNRRIFSKEEQDAMRREAKRMLPVMLHELAQRHGFSYSQVKITSAKGRWGSCSSRKNINLSLYLMQLPEHLIRYVLLHELCHTKEMNHGSRFWQMLDSVTDNKAKTLAKEIKKIRKS